MPDELHRNKMAAWMLRQFNKDPEEFPGHGQIAYDKIFLSVEQELNKIHKEVGSFAAISDKQGFLTDHGPEHIAMVMRRAKELSDTSSDDKPFETPLKPYEVFILLLSCHCHDVGNVYGREGHEARIMDVIMKIPQYGELKPSEWRLIAQIATVHGGTIDDDKDTIGKAIASGQVDLCGKTIRPQLLAAILRLADELSDDSSRASNYGFKLGTIPRESEIYHRFAKCLETVRINTKDKCIELGFVLYPDDLNKPFGYLKATVKSKVKEKYLIDEIYKRTKKTFCELMYCMKFMRMWPNHYDRVKVDLKAFVSHQSFAPFYALSFTLTDKGYPSQVSTDIKQLCDGFDGLDGSALKAKYEEAKLDV
ncbi:MAG: hypothetical protein JNN17_26685 [Verrucomicrobiaceae bacterium]|nr:hypothetical protein [Verrucomicrobiaceae bacterium]